MQTFLPYKSFTESLNCLDNKRLGKQRVEAMQILNVLEGKTTAWQNHPTVKMWKGYHFMLSIYHDLSILLWIERGFKNNMKLRWFKDRDPIILNKSLIKESFKIDQWNDYPHWLTEDFCNAHKSNLLRKDPTFYGKYNWNVPDNLPYVWPI